MFTEKIGNNAGLIWNALSNGELEVKAVKKATKLKSKYKNRIEIIIGNIENKEDLNKDVAASVAMPQQDATARDSKTPQRATLQNMAAPQLKKRGLFGRVLNAVFNDDE